MAGKRYKAAAATVDVMTNLSVAEAVKAVKANATAKFDETIEIAMNLSVDPRHADQMVRGVCNLPNGTGRSARVAVFAKDAKADEARAAGADIVGAEDLVEQIQNGEMDFERVIATPDMMPLVGRVARVSPRLSLTPRAALLSSASKKLVSFTPVSVRRPLRKLNWLRTSRPFCLLSKRPVHLVRKASLSRRSH